MQLAGALFGLILVVLGVITVAVHRSLAGRDHAAVHGTIPALDDLTVGLSRVLFPIVIVLGLNGLLVGVLNAHDHFTIPALSPLVWNIVIIVALVVLTPVFEGDEQIYAYAIGVLGGTAASSRWRSRCSGGCTSRSASTSAGATRGSGGCCC